MHPHGSDAVLVSLMGPAQCTRGVLSSRLSLCPSGPCSGAMALAWPPGRLGGGGLCSLRVTPTSSKAFLSLVKATQRPPAAGECSALTLVPSVPAPSVPSSVAEPAALSVLGPWGRRHSPACRRASEERAPRARDSDVSPGLWSPSMKAVPVMGTGLRGDQVPWAFPAHGALPRCSGNP